MVKRPLRRGHVVQVEFLDHVMDGSEAMPFLVFGRIGHIDRKVICIDAWCHVDRRIPHDHNVTRYTILRSCIRKVTHLEAT